MPERYFSAAGGMQLNATILFYLMMAVLIALFGALIAMWLFADKQSRMAHRGVDTRTPLGLGAVRCPKCGTFNPAPPAPAGENRIEFQCSGCGAKMLYLKNRVR